MQKGTLVGGSGHAQIVAARTAWREEAISCDSAASDFVLPACSAHAQFNNLSASASATAQLNATLRSAIRHLTAGWAVADVTEIAQCQLRQLELASPTGAVPDTFELGFLWQPVEPAEDVRFYRLHYPHRAAGDPLGDADRVFNESSGRTEWHSSESSDPPMLVVYYRG